MTTPDTTALQERVARELEEMFDGGGFNARDMARDLVPLIAAEVRAAKAEALREMQEHHEREADKAQTITARGIHLTIADGARNRATGYETGDRA